MSKKVIIIEHNGGRLANQLWLYMSVYAYCLHKGYQCENYTFFEYSDFFTIKSRSKLVKVIFFRPYSMYIKFFTFIGLHKYAVFMWRLIYSTCKNVFLLRRGANILYPEEAHQSPIYYLPPTRAPKGKLRAFETSSVSTLYLSGWLFRNPTGIKKYRSEIKKYFKPKKEIWRHVSTSIRDIRREYGHIVGVHIRQGDYKTSAWHNKYMSPLQVSYILMDYLEKFNKKASDTCFLICSDEKVNSESFKKLNIRISRSGAIEDLFLLSLTDRIIGSDSTFGSFASYYGDIPYIVLRYGGMDWDYYRDKNQYFENKYNTTAHF